MRKLLLLFAITLALFGEVEYAKNVKSALEQAKKEDKMVMVMLSKEDCDACYYMEEIVFDDDDTAEMIMQDFIPVHLDIHNDYVGDYPYIGTPTFYFLDKNGKKVYRQDGAANIKDFTQTLKIALSKK